MSLAPALVITRSPRKPSERNRPAKANPTKPDGEKDTSVEQPPENNRASGAQSFATREVAYGSN
jgi:hypothetical protein